MISITDVAISRLSESCCSEYELRLFLEKEFESVPNLDSRIDTTLRQLKEAHLINDLRIATNLAQRYAHKGNRLITQILRQKGIPEEIIAHVLDNKLDHENVRALDEARKKLRQERERSENVMTSLHRFLSGRSFSYHVIDHVLDQLSEQRPCLIN